VPVKSTNLVASNESKSQEHPCMKNYTNPKNVTGMTALYAKPFGLNGEEKLPDCDVKWGLAGLESPKSALFRAVKPTLLPLPLGKRRRELCTKALQNLVGPQVTDALLHSYSKLLHE